MLNVVDNILINPRGMLSFKNNIIKYSKYSFSDLNEFEYIYNIKQIKISSLHVLWLIDSNTGKTYLKLVNDLKWHVYSSDEFEYLSTICLTYKRPSISSYLTEKEFNKFKNIAEVGVMYGCSSRYICSNFSFAHFDLFEVNELYKPIIIQNIQEFKNFSKCNLYFGNYTNELARKNIIYDLIFFDPNQKYTMTFDKLKNIFLQFLPHIDENTLVIFDDYDKPEVEELVKYVLEIKKFKVRYRINRDKNIIRTIEV